MLFEIARIVLVVVLLAAAALLAAPPSRLPIALRGLERMLRKGNGRLPMQKQEAARPVSAARRAAACALVAAAAALCAIR